MTRQADQSLALVATRADNFLSRGWRVRSDECGNRRSGIFWRPRRVGAGGDGACRRDVSFLREHPAGV